MGIALLLQELPEKGGQLGSHMPTGDAITPITQLTMCGIACGANKGSQLSQLELHTDKN